MADLQNFVNVALATAAGGEDDFANDRLSHLRTVGSGFSSLIYNLNPLMGFRELSGRCTFVWMAYENDRNLPKLLVLYLHLLSETKTNAYFSRNPATRSWSGTSQ